LLLAAHAVQAKALGGTARRRERRDQNTVSSSRVNEVRRPGFLYPSVKWDVNGTASAVRTMITSMAQMLSRPVRLIAASDHLVFKGNAGSLKRWNWLSDFSRWDRLYDSSSVSTRVAI
jgi:hypothetical protein